ncbi:hypothetical protein AB1Y20_011026 [Prymnesium parvum]|uniref:Transmembrane protein 107 n=1 Tax=Prymnesium parvum TaxID=97485 RepID=A0AB34ILQ5_PRYPA
MAARDTLVPVRFLAMLGHLLAVLLLFFARRDNVLVALRFNYSDSEYDAADSSLVICLLLMLACLCVAAFGFFGGFTMFDSTSSIIHIVCHFTGGLLLSIIVIRKAHYVYAWFVFSVFSVVPLICELVCISSVVMLKRRRW